MFKQFDIGGSKYFFCVEDFEIVKIEQGRKIKNVLESIRNKKQQSEKKLGELKEKNINDNIKYYNTNMIGVNLVNGCNLS